MSIARDLPLDQMMAFTRLLDQRNNSPSAVSLQNELNVNKQIRDQVQAEQNAEFITSRIENEMAARMARTSNPAIKKSYGSLYRTLTDALDFIVPGEKATADQANLFKEVINRSPIIKNFIPAIDNQLNKPIVAVHARDPVTGAIIKPSEDSKGNVINDIRRLSLQEAYNLAPTDYSIAYALVDSERSDTAKQAEALRHGFVYDTKNRRLLNREESDESLLKDAQMRRAMAADPNLTREAFEDMRDAKDALIKRDSDIMEKGLENYPGSPPEIAYNKQVEQEELERIRKQHEDAESYVNHQMAQKAAATGLAPTNEEYASALLAANYVFRNDWNLDKAIESRREISEKLIPKEMKDDFEKYNRLLDINRMINDPDKIGEPRLSTSQLNTKVMIDNLEDYAKSTKKKLDVDDFKSIGERNSTERSRELALAMHKYIDGEGWTNFKGFEKDGASWASDIENEIISETFHLDKERLQFKTLPGSVTPMLLGRFINYNGKNQEVLDKMISHLDKIEDNLDVISSDAFGRAMNNIQLHVNKALKFVKTPEGEKSLNTILKRFGELIGGDFSDMFVMDSRNIQKKKQKLLKEREEIQHQLEKSGFDINSISGLTNPSGRAAVDAFAANQTRKQIGENAFITSVRNSAQGQGLDNAAFDIVSARSRQQGVPATQHRVTVTRGGKKEEGTFSSDDPEFKKIQALSQVNEGIIIEDI